MREYIKGLARDLPAGLTLATMTAAVTLIFAIALSAITGAYNENLRQATRCRSAQIVEMLKEVVPNPEEYPSVNVSGLDCSEYILRPYGGEEVPQ